MKKLLSVLVILATLVCTLAGLTSCSKTEDYTVGIVQLMQHESLDKATEGFQDALIAELEKAGKTVKVEIIIPGDPNTCSTAVNTLLSMNVDLIMANATPALVSASQATDKIPILGTSVTDYNDAFGGSIPANVSGTSDSVPFDTQAQMMIDDLGLTTGSKVGVIYCSAESNSQLQYEAVKAYLEERGVVVTAYTFSDPNDLQTVATSAVNASDAIYVPSDNTVATYETIVDEVARAAKTPVYASYGGSICYGSLAIDYYQLGYRTGVMAAEILLGTKSISDYSVETVTPTVTYNKELCDLLGITVPEN